MKKKPIIFNSEMVRAILDGRKTQTRRLIKPQPEFVNPATPKEDFITDRSPYKVGDALYVRETFGLFQSDPRFPVEYRADYTKKEEEESGVIKWTPSIHMPEKLSRIHLEVTRVRVERACDISEEDALAEGCHKISMIGLRHGLSPKGHFQSVWTDIYGPDAWDKWCWVYDFRRIK